MRYVVMLLLMAASASAQESPRKLTPLNGEWTFHRDGSSEKKTVALPTHWETHEGLKFDGIGWYEKTIDLPELPKGRRLLLHFDGVATHATVYWNDKKLGAHLGAWTPFRFDVTEHVASDASGGHKPPEPVRPAKDPEPLANAKTQGANAPRSPVVMRKHTIKVRVDEKVGHNTQGFLPIIAPHFGGIWQGVRLMEVPDIYLDDLHASLRMDAKTGTVKLSVPIIKHSEYKKGDGLLVNGYIHSPGSKSTGVYSMLYDGLSGNFLRLANVSNTIAIEEKSDSLDLAQSSIQIEHRFTHQPYKRDWSTESRCIYKYKLSFFSDVIEISSSFRSIETKADQFLLNGQPLSIRGVLNWGYYPPSLAPTPTEEQWRSDIRLIKSWGFNLMKCCLWVPPKRLLEIADEEGILIWLEYPTWHPKLTPQYQAELMQEYREFHQLDRNHPSVILRSLTCETGPSADIKVIQALYDQCKKMCGGLVVDDSSWIEWNRVFDFYDDHPYGNNHTWVATLDRLKKYIATSKYGIKPLCLGEAIAADTWVPTKPMLEAIAKAKADPKQAWSFDERGLPFWVPGFFEANQKWLERMGKVCGGPVDEKLLHEDSLTYAMKMRRYQMRTFQNEVRNGGYVVSVLRDFPLASMGLLDYEHKPKWSVEEWRLDVKRAMDLPTVYRLMMPEPAKAIRQLKKLTPADLDYLEQGGIAIVQANGSTSSFPLRSHWFLRGGPYLNRNHRLCQGNMLSQMFTENQHFDLASDVIPEIDYLEEIDPILMLWDNHDIKTVKTHGLLFETRVGSGRLLVSAISLDDKADMTKAVLKKVLLKHLDSGPPPRNALKPETIARMRAKLNEKKLDLTKQTWRFLPDGKNEGLSLGYEKPGYDDTAWKPIKIGQHWDGQGYPALDGWAWYRLRIDVPKDWAGVPLFWNTEGVDDAYELYVNGTKVGSGGDIPNKKTAFEERKAHAMPAGLLKAGEKNEIAVRVLDWQGAGGIHRPMSLTNVPIGGVGILK
jgi:hypothetical protein